jgi:signal transduction histidine kinase/CheY-like chemotaxis protein
VQSPRLIAYVFAWTALVATVFLGAGGASGEDHARAGQALGRLRVLQSELDADLAARPADPERAAPDTEARFAALIAAADALPSAVDLELHPRVGEALADYVTALRHAAAPARAASAALSDRARAATHAGGPSLASLCESLATRYSESFGERLEQSETYRVCLFLLTGLLFARVVQSMRELQRRTSELHTVNRTLEARVDERTRSLSATNRALETAIGEARRAERDALAAREAAEAANRTKSSFLANMSHEIRTPMTSILGFAEKLLDEDLGPAERADAVATIRRNGEHLSQLVNDILDLSKIEAGQFTIERVPCSPFRIAEDLRAGLAPRAAEKGLELVVEWASGAPRAVLTDPLRVEQVLYNLVGNAIKFTERGRIVVRVGYDAPSGKDGSGRLWFSVEDTGIGMDPATLARLFRPFVQGDSSTTRRYGGTGLGLSICHHLVSRLGGAIGVSSRPGSGSTFRFHVDAGPSTGELLSAAAPDALAPAARPEEVVLDGLRILLVEDAEDTRRLLVHFLERAGARVDVAGDGEAGRQAALRAQDAGAPYDVVFMDAQMPVLDGYAATERLRAAGYARPIVALTANALAADRERSLSAGCDDYCAKPVRRADLIEVAWRWGRASTEDEEPMKSRKDQDEELVGLVRRFVEELHQDVDAMRRALEEGDLEHLSTLAHRLKGAAGSYGFPQITRQAALLEQAARSGGARDALSCELASLEAVCSAAESRGNARGESA